jgi:nucleoside 2-deoxyribosyltransferase
MARRNPDPLKITRKAIDEWLDEIARRRKSLDSSEIEFSDVAHDVFCWDVLAPISGAGRLGSCLVAMAFDPAMDAAYETGIKPAVVTDCGFDVIRVDKVQFNDSINDRIIVGIRTAQFVIADVTLQRNGVYFEGGYAMGLGRPVIWMVRKDDLQNVHFDTKSLNHIVWEDVHDLRTKLAIRIQGTIPGAKLPARLS